MKCLTTVLIVFCSLLNVSAQKLDFEKVAISDSESLAMSMQNLASALLQELRKSSTEMDVNDRFRIELLAGNYTASIQSIELLRKNSELNNGHESYIPFELFAKAKIKQVEDGVEFDRAFQSVFRSYLAKCTDQEAYTANIVFTTYDAVAEFTNRFKTQYGFLSDDKLAIDAALSILRDYFLFRVFTLTEQVVFREIELDEIERYDISEELIISPRDGAEISLIIARKKNDKAKPAVLIFTIYADFSNRKQAILAASKGYVGVVANSRGKRSSRDVIEPYKHEYKDVNVVIDWISKQEWNNGKVGMYGGSYNGFSQWASMKERVHPALKTIVPSVSAAPGIDVPMENNVFFNFPYKWIPYVTKNRFLDNASNLDRERWSKLEESWFKSGKAYQKMDSLDGSPNALFQEWISHPEYDEYWQNMIPYKDEFAKIDIPVLTTTGYYDDGQRGAMYYYTEHLKYNPEAEHYLLIGPYDHWGAQGMASPVLRDYQIDSIANIDIRNDLVFSWFDYILMGKKKPSILQDKVNFQVMGSNQWMSKPSIAEMSNDSLVYHLSQYAWYHSDDLESSNSTKAASLNLKVDFADRSHKRNADYYPWPIIKDSIDLTDGLVFKGKALKEETFINGSFSGLIKVSSNKKDFDFAINLYELTPEGKYFHLSYYIGRASYAENREKRVLLVPNQPTDIAFNNTRIVSKKISKGSQIVIILNVNKNASAQINYGSGKDVSTESIIDAGTPLELRVHPQSRLTLPVWNEK